MLMTMGMIKRYIAMLSVFRGCYKFFIFLFLSSCGQVSTIIVSGSVVNSSGSVIQGATITVDGSSGECCSSSDLLSKNCTFVTNDSGQWSLTFVSTIGVQTTNKTYKTCNYSVSKPGFITTTGTFVYCKTTQECAAGQNIVTSATLN